MGAPNGLFGSEPHFLLPPCGGGGGAGAIGGGGADLALHGALTVVSAQQRTAADPESRMHFDFFLVVVAPTTPTCQPALQSTMSELQTCERS